ncbi:MAG: excinuclease ABC subunit UvrC [Candidatus Nanoarchaeia archaeon]
MKPQEINQLPLNPGCYLFKDKSGKVIYVGKAKSLKKRVSNYFQNKNHDSKTNKLVLEIDSIDFIITLTETEALILENSLIKKYYPRYNIDMKDAQKYSYIHLTNTELPWIEVERARDNNGEYYGPFVSASIRKYIFDVLTRNFKILYKKPSLRMKKLIDPLKYQERVIKARKILQGKVDDLIHELENEMQNASGKTYYEYAISLRNQINALKSLKEKQLIEQKNAFDSNIINYAIVEDKVYLLIFTIRKGVLEGKQEYVFDYREDFLNEFLLRFYDTQPIPNEIILPSEFDYSFVDYLTNKKGKKVSVIIPKKGDKKQLLELVLKNIYLTFFPGKEKIIQLQKWLKLEKLPMIIECFDISHLSGTNTVASMVRFNGGVMDKSSYRKFKISSDIISDDYAAMREVITRRYSGSLSKSMSFPDLIIVDGGKGQLSAGLEALNNINLKIPIISLAKRLEEIFVPGKEDSIILDKKSKALQLLQQIRDEAHRFAISYQKLLRSKEIR